MEENNTIIELINVTKSFGSMDAVSDFSLKIKKGEFVTLLGPSGCGKSTTLRMIAGFDAPTSGQILLGGEDITKLPPYKRPINTVFQRYALFPHLDVYDNIAFGLKFKKVPDVKVKRNGEKKEILRHLTRKEIDDKVTRTLRMVDLEELEDRDISTLSGGQQQRVAIARAIVNEPEILLLDEPLGALDLKMRKDMQIELKEMHKKIGITFIYVTHDQEEALTMSDTIVVMNNGAIQQVGNPIDIYNEPNNAFVANFIGESNIYNATMVSKLHVRFLNHVFECVDDFPVNEKVDVVIRPEDVVLKRATKQDEEDYKNKKKDAPLIGYVQSRLFKGIHYQYVIKVGKNELIVQDTKEFPTDSYVKIDIEPELIHIMKKDLTSNLFYDAWIDKQNRLVISDIVFDCDVTQLLPESKLDDEGYLIDTKTHKKYDLKDADVIAEIGLNDIEMSDSHEDCDVTGEIISLIYKGDHYQALIRTEEEEEFIVDTEYDWNEGDIVGLKIPSNKIKLTLKGDISTYEV